MDKLFLLSEQERNEVLNYLVAQPYANVYKLINSLVALKELPQAQEPVQPPAALKAVEQG